MTRKVGKTAKEELAILQAGFQHRDQAYKQHQQANFSAGGMSALALLVIQIQERAPKNADDFMQVFTEVMDRLTDQYGSLGTEVCREMDADRDDGPDWLQRLRNGSGPNPN